MSTVQAGIAQPKPLTVPNSDFCEFAGTLNAEELAAVKQVRVFMEHKVAPIINKYWADDAFPFELLPALKEPNIDGLWPSGVRLRRRKPEAFLASSPWRWHASTPRSAPSSAPTAAWRWAPSTSTDRRSRNGSGCRRWRA